MGNYVESITMMSWLTGRIEDCAGITPKMSGIGVVVKVNALY